MPDLQGFALFLPGIEQVVSAQYTIAHGITPGAFQFELSPSSAVASQFGVVQFVYGSLVLEFDGCKVDSASFDFSTGSWLLRVTILDRRWMWAFGQISGQYNLRMGDGSLDTSTEQTPQSLAKLCLDAMGEANYDVSALPNDTRPTVEWDYGNPAEALQRLCDELGCRVVLKLDGTVALCVAGQGASLPATNDMRSFAPTADPPEMPDSLVVVGAPVRHQVDLPLRAVGLDVDGTVQPIDQLSYAPNDGWSSVDFGFCNSIRDPKVREKAIASVFKWYQVDPVATKTIPGYDDGEGGDGAIEDLRQILPIGVEQVETTTERSLGQTVARSKPAQVFGVWHDNSRTTESDNTDTRIYPLGDGTSDRDKKILIEQPFRIDAELGIVMFENSVYQQDTSSSTAARYKPAELRLRTSVCVRSRAQRAVERYQRSRDLKQNFGTEPRYLRQDDIECTTVADYGGSYDAQPALETNRDDCDRAADYYLDAAQNEYQQADPETRGYVGIKPIELDGAIQRVTFQVDTRGATTTASRNTDQGHPGIIPYKQRRLTEKTREALRSLPLLIATAATSRVGLKSESRTGLT